MMGCIKLITAFENVRGLQVNIRYKLNDDSIVKSAQLIRLHPLLRVWTVYKSHEIVWQWATSREDFRVFRNRPQKAETQYCKTDIWLTSCSLSQLIKTSAEVVTETVLQRNVLMIYQNTNKLPLFFGNNSEDSFCCILFTKNTKACSPS